MPNSPSLSFSCSKPAAPNASLLQANGHEDAHDADDDSVAVDHLPPEATNVLKTWLLYHPNNPFPTLEEMHTISRRAGVSVNVIRLWFESRQKTSSSSSADDLRWSANDDDGGDGGGVAEGTEESVTSKQRPGKRQKQRHRPNSVVVVDDGGGGGHADHEAASSFMTPEQTMSSDPASRERLTLKKGQADVLRTWLYNNKTDPVMKTEDFEELVATTKLTRDQIQRWMNFALKKNVKERLFPVWRKKGAKMEIDERVSLHGWMNKIFALWKRMRVQSNRGK